MENKAYMDIKVYRFRAPLLKSLKNMEYVEFKSDGPVPIYNESQKIIGFATISDQRQFGMANCAIDPANPERLDLELNNRQYWMDAILEFRGFMSRIQGGYIPTVAIVKGLMLTTTSIPDQEPLNPSLGGLV